MTNRSTTNTWRGLQTFLILIVVALATWIGHTTQESQVQISAMQVQIALLQSAVAGVPDLKAEVTAQQVEINDNVRRLDNLESRGAQVKGWQR